MNGIIDFFSLIIDSIFPFSGDWSVLFYKVSTLSLILFLVFRGGKWAISFIKR